MLVLVGILAGIYEQLLQVKKTTSLLIVQVWGAKIRFIVYS